MLKKPGQGKVTSKKDFKPKEKKKEDKKDKKFIPFAEYMGQAGSAAEKIQLTGIGNVTIIKAC